MSIIEDLEAVSRLLGPCPPAYPEQITLLPCWRHFPERVAPELAGVDPKETLQRMFRKAQVLADPCGCAAAFPKDLDRKTTGMLRQEMDSMVRQLDRAEGS